MGEAGSNRPTRVIVTAFDALAQAELWLTHGPTRATEILLGILRTALLLGEQLVVDRNQVLDGIFFLSLGPDGIAAELGLPAGAPLPLLMTADAQPPLPAEVPVPRLLARAEGAVSLERQLAHVRSDRFLTASSAMVATVGRLPSNSWAYPEPAPGTDWYPGSGLTDVLHPLPSGDAAFEAARSLLHRAQDAWAEAIRRGRVPVDFWGGEMDMARAVRQQRRMLAEACGRELVPHPLAELALTIDDTSVRKEAMSVIEGEGRSADALACRRALALWSRAYYQAIAWKDEALLLRFNTPAAPSETEADHGELRRFGLALPVRSPWQRWWDRRSLPTGAANLRVEGEILDHLQVVDPGSFRRLARQARPVVDPIVRGGDPRAMHDLVLACRAAVAVPSDHARARRTVWLRIFLTTLLVAVVTALGLLTDLAELSPGVKVAVVVGAAVIGLLASLPWDAIGEELSLRHSSMTATLNLRQETDA